MSRGEDWLPKRNPLPKQEPGTATGCSRPARLMRRASLLKIRTRSGCQVVRAGRQRIFSASVRMILALRQASCAYGLFIAAARSLNFAASVTCALLFVILPTW